MEIRKYSKDHVTSATTFLDFSLRVFEYCPMRLCTKFQVSSSTRFGDTLGCTPKFMGVTRPRPRPFSRFSLWVFWGIADVRRSSEDQNSRLPSSMFLRRWSLPLELTTDWHQGRFTDCFNVSQPAKNWDVSTQLLCTSAAVIIVRLLDLPDRNIVT